MLVYQGVTLGNKQFSDPSPASVTRQGLGLWGEIYFFESRTPHKLQRTNVVAGDILSSNIGI